MKPMREHDLKMVLDLIDLLTFVPPGSVGVEVGCYMGESTQIMLESGRFKKLICIDPWNPGYYRDRDMAEAEREFDRRVAQAQHTEVIKLKMDSREGLVAAAQYAPVDFCYIDGDHRYHAVRDDIEKSLILLHGGGIISGHDYGRARSPGVKDAVKELLGGPDIRFAGWSWLRFVERLNGAQSRCATLEAVDTRMGGGSPACGASRGLKRDACLTKGD